MKTGSPRHRPCAASIVSVALVSACSQEVSPSPTTEEPIGSAVEAIGWGNLVPPTWVPFQQLEYESAAGLGLAQPTQGIQAYANAPPSQTSGCSDYLQEGINTYLAQIVGGIRRRMTSCGPAGWAECFSPAMGAAAFDARMSELVSWMDMRPVGPGTPFFWSSDQGLTVALAQSMSQEANQIATDTSTIGRYVYESFSATIPGFEALKEAYPVEYGYFQARAAHNWALAAVAAAKTHRPAVVGWVGSVDALRDLCSDTHNYFNQIEAPILGNAVYNERSIGIAFYTTYPNLIYANTCWDDLFHQALQLQAQVSPTQTSLPWSPWCATNPIGNGLPAGSYGASCDECAWNAVADSLTCACAPSRWGAVTSTTLSHVSNCGQEIANCGGQLYCGAQCP